MMARKGLLLMMHDEERFGGRNACQRPKGENSRFIIYFLFLMIINGCKFIFNDLLIILFIINGYFG